MGSLPSPSEKPPRAVALALVLSEPLALFEALRPKQWIKNLFVLAGVVFSGQAFEVRSCLRALVCFASFCAASSAVYLVNDVFDREADARHPTKRLRPLASGRLRPKVAVTAALFLACASLASAWSLSRPSLLVLGFYLAMSAAYTSGLKRVFILDVLIVASGFVLRAVAGAVAVEAEISPWLVCCTFLLALFLALGKRRSELKLLGEGAARHRENLATYTLPLLDAWLTAVTAATLVCYALYTQAPRTVENFHTANLLYTVPFVVYALFRYQYLVLRENAGGDPGSAILHDRGILVAICGWVLVSSVIVYS